MCRTRSGGIDFPHVCPLSAQIPESLPKISENDGWLTCGLKRKKTLKTPAENASFQGFEGSVSSFI